MSISLMQIEDACAQFHQLISWLDDPDRVVGTCDWVSYHFTRCCTNLQAKEFHLIGFRSQKPNICDYYRHYENPCGNFSHTVCSFPGNIIVDPTYRQLDTRGPAILITTREEIEKEWLVSAEDSEGRDIFMAFANMMEGWHETDDKTRLESADIEMMSSDDDEHFYRRAQGMYALLSETRRLNRLVLPGDASTNCYLAAEQRIWQHLSRQWKDRLVTPRKRVISTEHNGVLQ